jgi:hypothetical protein
MFTVFNNNYDRLEAFADAVEQWRKGAREYTPTTHRSQEELEKQP